MNKGCKLRWVLFLEMMLTQIDFEIRSASCTGWGNVSNLFPANAHPYTIISTSSLVGKDWQSSILPASTSSSVNTSL